MKEIIKSILIKLGIYNYIYWYKRAKIYGKRAVLDINYSADEYESVTERHKLYYEKLLNDYLKYSLTKGLDFGCGTGRYTNWLTETLDIKMIGVDISKKLLSFAKPDEKTKFVKLNGSKLPFENDSFDFVWCCLVLGGIPDRKLPKTINEIRRVLKTDGKLVLIENTSDISDKDEWFYRTKEKYQELFTEFELNVFDEFNEFNDKITIFYGANAK